MNARLGRLMQFISIGSTEAFGVDRVTMVRIMGLDGKMIVDFRLTILDSSG
jgi:hypothetical protein